MSKATDALEVAREAYHADRANRKTLAAYKAACVKVVAERQVQRLEREAAGPPVAAPGDAIVRPGGA